MTDPKDVVRIATKGRKLSIKYNVNGKEFTSLMSASKEAYPGDMIKRNVFRTRVTKHLNNL